MKNMTLQKQILERIQKERVRPTPRGYFKLRDYAVWFLLGVSVAALSIGVGMIIFMIRGADFALFEKLGLTASEKVAYSIPFFWVLASLALAGVALLNFRKTRRGYRVKSLHFVMVSILVALALGSIAYALNITDYVNKVASENIPVYNSVVPLNTGTWLDPERGLLSGYIRSKESQENFTLRDSSSELWHVKGDNIVVTPRDWAYSTGDRIKIIGTKTGEGEFRAIEIRQWEEPRLQRENRRSLSEEESI